MTNETKELILAELEKNYERISTFQKYCDEYVEEKNKENNKSIKFYYDIIIMEYNNHIKLVADSQRLLLNICKIEGIGNV